MALGRIIWGKRGDDAAHDDHAADLADDGDPALG
jgi:hypothetical protein